MNRFNNFKFFLVKKENEAIHKFLIGFGFMVFSFWACTTTPGKVGSELLPASDLVVTGKTVNTNIQSYTFNDEVLRTDESNYNIFGTFNDPIFGKTIGDFACQYRLSGYPPFKTGDKVDSLVLYIAYKEIYGDTLTPQHFRVYELATDIPFDDKFYQNVDLKSMSYSDVLGELYYVPKFRLDSLSNKYGSTNAIPKDTVTQEIAIKMSDKLINKLLAADSLTNSSNTKFLNYFKGLYVEAVDQNQHGTLMKVMGSGLIMYFHKTDVKDSTFTYKNNKNASRVGRIVHDYSTTSFAKNLNSELIQDSIIYAQTSGGIRSKIYIPDLGIWSKMVPESADDPDTIYYTLNKAELIFKLDTAISQPKYYRPSEQLVLAAIGESSSGQDSTYLPSDHAFSASYYGGTYNIIDRTYRFNIAQHIQDIVNKKPGTENNGFYLETAYKNSTLRRVALKGAASKTSIRLEITYSIVK